MGLFSSLFCSEIERDYMHLMQEYSSIVHAHSALLAELYKAEREIVRLRKKCGEDWEEDFPHLL